VKVLVIFFTKQAYSLPVRKKGEHLLKIIRLNGFDSLKLQCSKHSKFDVRKYKHCPEIRWDSSICEFMNENKPENCLFSGLNRIFIVLKTTILETWKIKIKILKFNSW
jgi:hypothetical protein